MATAFCSLLTMGAAQAQMHPYTSNTLHQNARSGDYTSLRINLAQSESDATQGPGLTLRGKGFWPHWEGRIGVVIDRPANPLKNSFVLAQPNLASGMSVRSIHILSDYYLEGGFRATAGLLRGDTGQGWWANEGTGGGFNLSLQRLDNLILGNARSAQAQQTTPYLGAGYSNNLPLNGIPNTWRFNADLGLVSIGNSKVNSLRRVLQGERSLEELVREMRLRPVVKVSVGYSF